jgi:hypothetical protein
MHGQASVRRTMFEGHDIPWQRPPARLDANDLAVTQSGCHAGAPDDHLERGRRAREAWLAQELGHRGAMLDR